MIRSAPARFERQQRLVSGRFQVEPPLLRGRVQHRVLSGDVVRGDRVVELPPEVADDIEVRPGFHHQHVRALLGVDSSLAERLATVRGVHLVVATVAERGRTVGRVAEGPVKADSYLTA